MKTCIKCKKNKPKDCFYKHSMMKDGYLNECKECTKERSRNERNNNIDYVRNYDRERGKLLKRKNNCKIYALNNPEKIKIHKLKWENNNKYKRLAQNKLSNAIRDGKIIKPKQCSKCNKTNNIQGHHFDYSKPLEVIWVCPQCHANIHKSLKGVVANVK